MEDFEDSQIEVNEIRIKPYASAEIKEALKHANAENLAVVIKYTLLPYESFLGIKGVMLTLVKRAINLNKCKNNVDEALMEIIERLQEKCCLNPESLAEALINIRDS